MRGVSGVMQFLVAVCPRGLAERSKFGDRRNHPPRIELRCFVIGVGDLVLDLKETPRETQVASEGFVPANVFLFFKGLLDQQLSAT